MMMRLINTSQLWINVRFGNRKRHGLWSGTRGLEVKVHAISEMKSGELETPEQRGACPQWGWGVKGRGRGHRQCVGEHMLYTAPSSSQHGWRCSLLELTIYYRERACNKKYNARRGESRCRKNITRWGAKGQQVKAQFLYNTYGNLQLRAYLTKTLNREVLKVT